MTWFGRLVAFSSIIVREETYRVIIFDCNIVVLCRMRHFNDNRIGPLETQWGGMLYFYTRFVLDSIPLICWLLNSYERDWYIFSKMGRASIHMPARGDDMAEEAFRKAPERLRSLYTNGDERVLQWGRRRLVIGKIITMGIFTILSQSYTQWSQSAQSNSRPKKLNKQSPDDSKTTWFAMSMLWKRENSAILLTSHLWVDLCRERNE